MGKCNHWSDEGVQCTKEAVKQGMCHAHLAAIADAREEAAASAAAAAAAAAPPPQVMRWTPAEIKATLADWGESARDGSGGYFVGGGANEPHVHLYSEPGAHAKIGKEKYYFLRKPNNAFDRNEWDGALAAAKGLDETRRKKVFAAMATVLADYGARSEAEFDALMKTFGYERK